MSFPNQRLLSLPIQKWMKKRSTRKVIEALTQKGGTVRFVGGCVRDTLVGKTEPDNIDIATPLKPEEVRLLLQEQGLTTIPTGLIPHSGRPSLWSVRGRGGSYWEKRGIPDFR